jgi:hypothetical protein
VTKGSRSKSVLHRSSASAKSSAIHAAKHSPTGDDWWSSGRSVVASARTSAMNSKCWTVMCGIWSSWETTNEIEAGDSPTRGRGEPSSAATA